MRKPRNSRGLLVCKDDEGAKLGRLRSLVSRLKWKSRQNTELTYLGAAWHERGKGRRQGGHLLKGGAQMSHAPSFQLKTNDIWQKNAAQRKIRNKLIELIDKRSGDLQHILDKQASNS